MHILCIVSRYNVIGKGSFYEGLLWESGVAWEI